MRKLEDTDKFYAGILDALEVEELSPNFEDESEDKKELDQNFGNQNHQSPDIDNNKDGEIVEADVNPDKVEDEGIDPNKDSKLHKATEGASDWWESQNSSAQEQILLASGVDPKHKGLSWNNLGQENQTKIKEEYYEAREAIKEGDDSDFDENFKEGTTISDNFNDESSTVKSDDNKWENHSDMTGEVLRKMGYEKLDTYGDYYGTEHHSNAIDDKDFTKNFEDETGTDKGLDPNFKEEGYTTGETEDETDEGLYGSIGPKAGDYLDRYLDSDDKEEGDEADNYSEKCPECGKTFDNPADAAPQLQIKLQPIDSIPFFLISPVLSVFMSVLPTSSSSDLKS